MQEFRPPVVKRPSLTSSANRVGCFAGILLAAVCATGATPSFAQDSASVERFMPGPARSSDHLVTMRARVRDSFDWNVATLFDLSWKPLALRDAEGEVLSTPVNVLGVQHFLLGIGFGKRFHLGVDVPLVQLQRGDSVAGVGFDSASIGLMDIRVVPRIELWSSQRDLDDRGISVAIAGDVYVPTGDAELLRGGELRGGGRAMVDVDLGRVTTSVNLGYLAGPEGAVFGTLLDDEYQWSAAAAYEVSPEVDVMADIWGGISSRKSNLRRADVPAELGVGARWQRGLFLAESGVSTGVAAGFGTPVLRGWLAIGIAAAEPREQAPAVEPVSVPVPEPEVVPVVIQCDAENLSTFCPAPPAPFCDGNAVVNSVAACNSDGGCTVLEERVYCAENETCDVRDGVAGCHAEEEVEPQAIVNLVDQRIIINQRVYFDFDTANLQTRSHAILDEVAAVILEHPEIETVTIVGHTDSVGSDAYNQDLSQRRARAVQTYLQQRGLDANRLNARGAGESQPIAPNDNDEGRAQNRRVEFLINEGTP